VIDRTSRRLSIPRELVRQVRAGGSIQLAASAADLERLELDSQTGEPQPGPGEGAVIEREGDVNIRSWDEAGPTYRQDWERRYGASGLHWDNVEPYRRYSYEVAHEPRYRGRDWSEVEPELRTGYANWARRRGYRPDESAWERFRDNVREAWLETRSQVRR
jgi:hypothetical protein